jgi:ribonuclease E
MIEPSGPASEPAEGGPGRPAGEGLPGANPRRRRGSRGGRSRTGSGIAGAGAGSGEAGDSDGSGLPTGRPRIGDTRPAPPERGRSTGSGAGGEGPRIGDTRRPSLPGPQGSPPAGSSDRPESRSTGESGSEDAAAGSPGGRRRRRRRGGRGRSGGSPGAGGGGSAGQVEHDAPGSGVAPLDPEGDAEAAERRRGQERKGRPVGRYLMAVQVRPEATQVAVLEGRSLIEHYLSRPQDDATEIDGNIYLARVQNVLPGMEAAFVDIGTPKNAVLYRGDVRYDREDMVDSPTPPAAARIEELLKPGQTILCQVTKNPIGTKGARLTQEVSLPGRFVVLIPNSDTYGISKRLPDEERKRLRRVLDDVRPPGHGLIVRTAAEAATAEELRRDVARLLAQWEDISGKVRHSKAPALLYREPDVAVRIIREEFSRQYRGVIIDDAEMYRDVRDYVASISPELADRVELYDPSDPLPIFERHHIHEQLHKALDRKVWLPSGGSLIIERTEALTVIDVNTGKNVGTSNLEETVYRNNLEAAEEVARQLRLRDIGGIIVIDFIDMEVRANRDNVMTAFRSALARDKTRTQVFEMSELGLVEMTRKRIGEGLLASFTQTCPTCAGRGVVFDESLLSSD